MSRLRIFVRRGALRRFYKLTRDSVGLPVSVEWDRRQRERRSADAPSSSSEQREGERRREPPFTWNAGEFVVLDESAARKTDGND